MGVFLLPELSPERPPIQDSFFFISSHNRVNDSEDSDPGFQATTGFLYIPIFSVSLR